MPHEARAAAAEAPGQAASIEPADTAAAAAAAESPQQSTEDAWERLRASLQHLDTDPIVGTRQEPGPQPPTQPHHADELPPPQQPPLQPAEEPPHPPQYQAPSADEQAAAAAAATSSRARSASQQRQGAQAPQQPTGHLPPLDPWSRKRRPWQPPPRHIPLGQHNFHDQPQQAVTQSAQEAEQAIEAQPNQQAAATQHGEDAGASSSQQQSSNNHAASGDTPQDHYQPPGPQQQQGNRRSKPNLRPPSRARGKNTHLRRPAPKAARSNTKGGNTHRTLDTTKQQLAHPARRGHPAQQPSSGDVIPPEPGTKEPATKQTKRGSMRSSRREDGASRRTSHGDKLSTGCTARSNESKRSEGSHSRPPPEPTSRGDSPSCSTCTSSRESPLRGRPLTPDPAPQQPRAPRPHRSSTAGGTGAGSQPPSGGPYN